MRTSGRRWADLRRLPVVATPRATARGLALSFLTGGLLAGASTVLPGAPVQGVGTIRLLAVAALALTAALVRAGALSRGRYHALMLCGSGMTTYGLWSVCGDGSAYAYAALYVLIVANAFTGSSWLGAGAHLALNTASVATVLALQPGARPALVVVSAGMLVGASLFVGRLVRTAAAAELDALTGLVNRRGLDRHLDGALARAERAGAPLSAAVVDLDHFKRVNDELGHAAGDALLREVARRWSAALPDGVLLARSGGDEFVLVAERPAAALATLVRELRALMPAGSSCSAGVADHVPGRSASSLVGQADSALYAVKRGRRGSVLVAAGQPSPPDRVDGAAPEVQRERVSP